MRVLPLLGYLALSSITLAATPPKATLLDLAKKKFAPRKLTGAEEKLFTNTERGEPASALTGDDKQDDPDSAGTWPDDRIIHAECLAWLCTESEASRRVTYRGIQIYGMRIDEKLDLEFAQIPFPLKTWKCAFTDEIILRHTHFAALYLQFTHVKDVAADGVKIDGNVFLRDRFRAEGEVRLLGALIGGDLDCTAAQLSNPNGKALNGDGAKINGYVFLRDGFKAEGEVNLLGATIGENLECSGAQLSNPSGIGLQASEIKIARSVFLTDGFEADGGVQLVGSEIKDYFDWYEILPAKNTRFDLRSAKVGTFHDEEKSWPVEGKLFLDGFTYDRIFEDSPLTAKSRIAWLHRQPRDKFLPQPYEQLASVLRNMGHEREARRVMIEKIGIMRTSRHASRRNGGGITSSGG